MKMSNYKNNKVFIAIATAVSLGTWALPAHAYLDPGTGSMLIQGIIGAVAAAGVALKLYWYKIKLMITGRKAESETINESQNSVSKD